HEERPHPRQPRRADRVRPDLVLPRLRQQLLQGVASLDDRLELRLRDSKERRVLARAEARVTAPGTAGQQRLLADVAELLELRGADFAAVAIAGAHLPRPAHGDVGAVARFAFPEDQRRGRDLDDLGEVGERPKLARLELAEQDEALEELLALG